MSAVHHSGALPREPDPDLDGPMGVPLAGIWIDDTPAIGRALEFDHMVVRLLAARGHQTSMIALSGEAGIGKTLLMHKVSERARHERFLVLWERMLEGDWQPPYHAWAGILQQAMTDLAWPTASDEPPDWAQTLSPILPHLSHLYPHLAPVANLSLQEERFRLPDAIVCCLFDLSQRCPLMIALDDIQWSDPGSLRVLLHLGRSTRPAALMVMIAYRDDYVDQGGGLIDVLNQIRRETSFEQIALRGLPIEDIQRLMHTLGAESVSPNLVRLVSEATQGNPFFVHEITRHLIEGHDLQAVTSVRGPLESGALSIPESLRQVVDHRLGRLSATAQRMLRLAAVCTDGFDFPMLRALTSLDEEELLDAIDEALAARLITPVGNEVDRYDFQHSLVRRALYDGWSPSRRIRLHRALATTLEQVHHDARHLYAPALAVHYHISASVPGAEAGVPYALLAARDAAHRSAPEQAASYLRMARDLATALPLAERAEIASALALAEANALWLDAALTSAIDAIQLLDEAQASDGEKAAFLALVVTGLHDGGQARELWMPLLYRGLAVVPTEDEVTWARQPCIAGITKTPGSLSPGCLRVARRTVDATRSLRRALWSETLPPPPTNGMGAALHELENECELLFPQQQERTGRCPTRTRRPDRKTSWSAGSPRHGPDSNGGSMALTRFGSPVPLIWQGGHRKTISLTLPRGSGRWSTSCKANRVTRGWALRKHSIWTAMTMRSTP